MQRHASDGAFCFPGFAFIERSVFLGGAMQHTIEIYKFFIRLWESNLLCVSVRECFFSFLSRTYQELHIPYFMVYLFG